MAIRAKRGRASTRRRTAAVGHPGRAKLARPRAERPPARSASTRPFAEAKPASTGINSYAKALRFLASLTDYERLRIVRYNSQNFDLDRMRTLLKKLGNPQDQFRSVHVAGTKGKGSTCAMIASMLQATGYKTGLYTSPHLIDIRERIQINGEMISQADFARLVRLIEPIVARMKPTPTYFDVLTAIAFKYFAEQKVEIAVVETGLGGRLDSTNVLKPEVTAITSISKDHMAQLGRHARQDRRGEGRHLQARHPRRHRAAGPGGRGGAQARGREGRHAARRRPARRSSSATGSSPAACSARTTASA